MENTENAVSSELVTSFDRFLRDGVKKENYQRWHKRKIPFAVPANTWVLIRKIFDKSEDSIEVVDNGVIAPNPIFKEYLFAPKNSTTIDYSTTTNNFKFQTDIANNGYEIEVDPVIKIRIIDPIKYLYNSNNVLADLQDLVSTVLREFVAKHTPKELIEASYSLEEIDSEDYFKEFTRQNGLKIENLRIKNVKLPKEVREARTQEEQAKSKVTQARYKVQEAKLDAESQLQFGKGFIPFARENKDMGIATLLELIRLAEIKSAPQNSHIIIGGNYPPYYPFSTMNDDLSNLNQQSEEETQESSQTGPTKSRRKQ